MKLKNKSLLVLGGITLSKEIIYYAKKLGLTVFVTDYLENSPAKKEADKSFMVSTTDVNAVSELIKIEKVDGVIVGFVDSLLPFYSEICDRNNLFKYGSKKQFELLHDKDSFKDLCRRFNVPVVEEFTVNGIDDDETIENLPYPILLKPSDNSGGRGITICNSAKEFKANYLKTQRFSKSETVIVERYMTSKEVSIFYYLQDGKIMLSAMGNRHTQKFKDGVIPLPVAYTFPSRHLDEYQKSLDGNVQTMFESLGLKDGMVFIQSFVEDGNCIFYEMGYRLTGSLEYKIIEHATGYNPLNLMIEKALTGTSEVINLNPNFEKKYCNITFLLTPGVIDRIEGVEEVKALSNVIDLFLSYDEGDEITPDMEGTLAQVVARVFAYGNTEEEVFNTMKKVIELFRVYSIENKEMIIPFEVKNLYF